MEVLGLGVAGEALIKGDEALRLKTYDDATGKTVMPGDTVHGKLTIAWGHTGPDVHVGMVIDEQRAEELFVEDITPRVRALNAMLRIQLNQNQFDAVLSLGFNIGMGALYHSSLMRLLNVGSITAAANQFLVWDEKDGKPDPGLKKRRKDELQLFNKPYQKVINAN